MSSLYILLPKEKSFNFYLLIFFIIVFYNPHVINATTKICLPNNFLRKWTKDYNALKSTFISSLKFILIKIKIYFLRFFF